MLQKTNLHRKWENKGKILEILQTLQAGLIKRQSRRQGQVTQRDRQETKQREAKLWVDERKVATGS